MSEERKYQIIYADPPWKFRVWSDKGMERSADRHYRTEHTANLSRLGVRSITAENSTLLMWATFPCLQQALELGRSWGFVYKTVAFVWVKQNRKSKGLFMGMGYYSRANAEIVLLFTKGKPLKRLARNVSQVLISPIARHSEKPAEIRQRIEQLFGDVTRIELFARDPLPGMPHPFKGWDVFGNEVAGSVNIPWLE